MYKFVMYSFTSINNAIMNLMITSIRELLFVGVPHRPPLNRGRNGQTQANAYVLACRLRFSGGRVYFDLENDVFDNNPTGR